MTAKTADLSNEEIDEVFSTLGLSDKTTPLITRPLKPAPTTPVHFLLSAESLPLKTNR